MVFGAHCNMMKNLAIYQPEFISKMGSCTADNLLRPTNHAVLAAKRKAYVKPVGLNTTSALANYATEAGENYLNYELDRENLQLLALRLSCKAHSLHNELRHCSDSPPLATQTLADVSSIITAVKPFVCWLDRSPFSGQFDYQEYKAKLLRLSLQIATCAQRDRFAERPVEEIRSSCKELANLADSIIQDIVDPLILQPASLDLATLKKRAGDDLGFFILPSFHGVHQIAEIKFSSPAHQCGKIEDGDEVVQVNYQTVIGKSGIHPLKKEEILKRLPSKNTAVDLELVGESFLSHLEKKRCEVVKPRSSRKKKLNVPAGQSITEQDLIQPQEEETLKTKTKQKQKGQKRQKKYQDLPSSDEDSDDYSIVSSGHSDLVFSSDEEVYKSQPTKTRKRTIPESTPGTSGIRNNVKTVNNSGNSQPLKDTLEEGNFVVVAWEGKQFPGLVMSVVETGAIVDCMEPTQKYWKWPKEKDMLFYEWSDIIQVMKPPKLLPAHQAGSQLARPCSKLVGFGPDQTPVARLHLTWLSLGFYPTSTRLLRAKGTPLGGEDRIE
uniref:(California timema) hypothetical protein n=1 Tax=Timema californicum TaxID=61474 RepID=A0A7R9J6B6_TIMCA|nr:unnamed protein product [Timema californicum]